MKYRWLCCCGAGGTLTRSGRDLDERTALATARAHAETASANQDHVWSVERNLGRGFGEGDGCRYA
jgi:hypothetical protein